VATKKVVVVAGHVAVRVPERPDPSLEGPGNVPGATWEHPWGTWFERPAWSLKFEPILASGGESEPSSETPGNVPGATRGHVLWQRGTNLSKANAEACL
jgi:hypothetical protein